MIRLLRKRDFRLLWLGGLISMIGDWALIAALPFEIYRRTGSALAAGGVIVAGLAPAILFGSTAGVLVDRWDRRKLMVWVNVAQFVILLPLFAIDPLGLWIAYAVLVVSNILDQLFVPAEVALLPKLVGPDDLVPANSLSSLNRNLARLIGPAIGGAAMAIGGLTLTVIVDMATYVIAAVLIGLIAPGASFRADRALVSGAAHATSAFRRLVGEWRDGISIATRHPMLRAMLVFALITAVGEGILITLIVPWVSDILHGDEVAWAAVLSSQALGGLIGAVIVGRFLSRVRPAVLLGVGTLIFSVIDLAIFTYPLVLPIVLPAVIGMVIVGIPISAMGVGTTTLQQSLVSDSHRGRVVGLFMAVFALGVVVGTVIAGVLAPTFGIIPLMAIDSVLYFACGLMILVVAGRLDSREQPAPVAPVEAEAA